MNDIQFQCESCGSTLKLPASAAGKTGKCPTCKSTFVIPSGQMPIQPTPSPVQAPARAPVQQPVQAPVQQPVNQPAHQAANPYAANPAQPYSPPSSAPLGSSQRPSLALMTIPLYISAGIYALIGIGFLGIVGVGVASGEAPAGVAFLFILVPLLCFAFAAFICFFTSQLPRRKKWAWITAIIFGAMYAPSAFIFLGIPILIGAFNRPVMDWFNRPN